MGVLLKFKSSLTTPSVDVLTSEIGPDLTVIRNSIANYIDENNLVVEAAIDTGRIDHSFRQIDRFGNDLIIDGGFDNSGDWNNDVGWNVGVSKASFDGVTSGYIRPNVTLNVTVGKYYQVEADIVSGLDVAILFGWSTGQYIYGDVGERVSAILYCVSTDFRIYGNAGTGATSIDNLSVKEVIPFYSSEPSVLKEDQAENLVTYSEDFSNWAQSTGPVLTAVSITNPTGTLGAYELKGTADGSRLQQNLGTLASGSYTQYLFVKYKSADVTFYFKNNQFGGTNSFQVTSTGVNIITNNDSAEVKSYANDWYRISITYTADGVTLSYMQIFAEAFSTFDTPYYLFGAQLELGSVATSYIKTSGSTVTRQADDISVTPPAGTKSITEWIGGIKQETLTVIPSSFIVKDGITDLIMTDSLMEFKADFTKEKEGFLENIIGPDWAVVRNSIANKINSLGLVEKAPYNITLNSNKVSGYGNWSSGGLKTLTEYQIANPIDGTVDGWLFEANEQSIPQKYISQNHPAVVGTNYNWSVSFKKGTNNHIALVTLNAYKETFFNLDLGIITSSSHVSASIEDLGNGWYKCSIVTLADTTVKFSGIYLTNAAGTSIGSPNFGGVYLYGAQFTVGNDLKPYQETTDRMDFPRVDYLDNVNPKVLVENQAINLVLYSEELDNANWDTQEITVTVGAAISPTGVSNATEIIPSIVSNRHQIWQIAYTLTLDDKYFISVYAKANGYDWIQIVPAAGFDTSFSAYANFDLINGVTGNSQIIDNKYIEDLGNGWYRCIVEGTVAANTAVGAFSVHVVDGNAVRRPIWVGDAVNGVYLFGPQVEINDAVSSYIKTEGSTVTRQADDISITPPVGTVLIKEWINNVLQPDITTIPGTFNLKDQTTEVSFLDVSSSPDVTINATTINAAVTLLTAVATGESGAVNAAVSAVTINIAADLISPVITAVQNTEVTATVINVVSAIIAPTITAVQNTEITAAVINASIDLPPVVVSSAGNTQVNAITINTVATVLSVTVITTGNTTITPVVLQSVVQVLVPTILAQRNVQIQAVLIQAGITILDPTVVIITDEDFVKIYVDMQLVKTVQITSMELVKTIKKQNL